MMENYWVTISVPAPNPDDAHNIAMRFAEACDGRIVNVDHEPPQGSMVVGDFWEHEDEPPLGQAER